MGRIFPPTLAEWHSAVIGFYIGFVYGASNDDAVATAGVRRAVGFTEAEGHLVDTRQEAAYTGGCFLVGVVVGYRWRRVRSRPTDA
ncbi:MAG: hypothetical protein ABEH58_04825 [Haloplanus sp.]